MPTRDLRSNDGSLDPLAPFMVLALMCNPRSEDKPDRDHMLSTIRADTGVGKPRVGTFTDEAFLVEVAKHASHAAICGFLLMTCIQRHELGEKSNLETAIELARSLPERWEVTYGSDTVDPDKPPHMPHSRRKAMDAFNHYLPVSHLWAAYVHGQQNDRPDIVPTSNETLPTFLAYGEAFANKAANVPFRSHNRRRLLPDNQRWHFTLPADSVKKVNFGALPFPHPT
jgi:hypothetical protein